MKNLATILFCTIILNIHAQVSNNFFGLARKSGPSNEVYLATINPLTGVVVNLSPNSLSPGFNLTGSALDPYNNSYHYITGNAIKSVDLTSGLETNAAVINNPIANSYFDNFRFNNSDTSLYGLARRYIYDTASMTGFGEIYLATINTQNGLITQLSPVSVAEGFALEGSAIDPYQKVFYFSGGSNLMGLDMYNGAIYSNAPISIPGGGIFGNFAYSCADTTLYGLIRTNFYSSYYDSLLMMNIEQYDSSNLHLGEINPSTGLVSIISPSSISTGGYAINAGATIDPSTMTYYYNNGSSLVGVSLVTGFIVSEEVLSNVSGCQYFDLMRIESSCYEVTVAARPNPATTVQIKELKNREFRLWPNPATDFIQVSDVKEFERVEIFNITGQMVKKIALIENGKILVSDLESGVYNVVGFHANQGKASLRFMKE